MQSSLVGGMRHVEDHFLQKPPVASQSHTHTSAPHACCTHRLRRQPRARSGRRPRLLLHSCKSMPQPGKHSLFNLVAAAADPFAAQTCLQTQMPTCPSHGLRHVLCRMHCASATGWSTQGCSIHACFCPAMAAASCTSGGGLWQFPGGGGAGSCHARGQAWPLIERPARTMGWERKGI